VFIRVVAKSGEAPEGDADGVPVWTGGHVSSSPEATSLPASILALLNPELEIGSWYTYETARQLLTALPSSGNSAWTTISIPQDGPDKDFETKLEVEEEGAVKLICDALIAYCDRLEGTSLWVRID
jgi:hypothetical protein